MQEFERRMTTPVTVGDRMIGADAKIAIQSMTNTPSSDVRATVRQVLALQDAGCDIVRLAVPDPEAAGIFGVLKREGVRIPLVADIHFDYKIALAAIAAGADKIRINPGNIGGKEKVRAVADACAERGIPIRIGVNSGSLEKDLLEAFHGPTAGALAESALRHAALLEDCGFSSIVLSVKSSDVRTMIAANRILAEKTVYPLHLGVTEAGAHESALVKSSLGIGTLLAEGIGDTIRVSLTDDPVEEVRAARAILAPLGLLDDPGMNLIACPTCGRTRVALIPLVRAFEDAVRAEGLDRLPLTVALMGCAVNGPGEAREADIGIAGGDGEGLLFKKGRIVRKMPEEELLPALLCELRAIRDERNEGKGGLCRG